MVRLRDRCTEEDIPPLAEAVSYSIEGGGASQKGFGGTKPDLAGEYSSSFVSGKR